ncbi:MAG: hypothetical protein A2V79_04425 [Betaproteobacteria bacterium RBG_16_56_24]|nr:MAG: hypothetical protein A2V79_04425 [Betaproteobacteria bacterium RBG_16_56_24]
MKFHPASQIMTWCLLVATMQALAPDALLVAACLILLCAFVISGRKFIQLARRTRWIMLSLLLIYAYSMPGQPLVDTLGTFSPSREGLTDGMLQLARLLAALAGLAILLDRLSRQQLIAGLYILFAPLQWMGLSRERLAVRLALTLHYAEIAMLRDTHGWQDTLRSLTPEDGGQRTEDITNDLAGVVYQPGQMASSSTRQIELPLNHFAVADALLLLSGAVLILWLALR